MNKHIQNIIFLIFLSIIVFGCSTKATRFFGEGEIFMEKGEYYKAIDCFNKALKEKPNYLNAIFNRGICYMELEEYGKAIADFDDSYKAAPFDVQPLYYRGLCKSWSEDYEGAIQDYTETLQLYSNHTEAHIDRAFAFYQLNKFEDAITDINTRIKINPKDTYALILRGNANYGLNEFESACADWKKAAENGSKDAVVFIKDYCNNNDWIKGSYRIISIDSNKIENNTCVFDGEKYIQYSNKEKASSMDYMVSNDTILFTKILKMKDGTIIHQEILDEKFIKKEIKGDTVILWDTFIEGEFILLKK